MLKHDVGSAKRDFYSPKEVCEEMGLKHNLVVTPKPPAAVDCMAREVLITEFCQKIAKDRMGLLRGKVDPYSEKVVCEYGRSLSLIYRCSPGYQEYCTSAKKGCERLGDVFAVGLNLDHSSILPDGPDQRLQCYFSASKTAPTEQKIIPPLNLEE